MANKASFRQGYRVSRRGYKGSVVAHGNRRYKIGKRVARGVSHSPDTAARVASSTASKAAETTIGNSSAQGIIVTSAMVTFTLGFLNSYLVPRKTPRIRLFIGVALLYIALSVVAQFNQKLGRAFAILVMVTAILGEGGGVMNWLLGRGTHDHIGVSSTGTPNLPPISLTTGPAASVSAPGTARAPNMFQAPLSSFPKVNDPFFNRPFVSPTGRHK